MVIVGAGAGGGTLAQRLARKGWRVVVLESGPFWDPDRDWVSDEAGQHKLYWTAPRVIGGGDPVELGKNNSGHGVGGIDDPLRRLRAALSSLGLRDADARRRRRRLADLLLGRSSRTTSGSSGSCRSPGRTGPGAIRTATRTPRTRSPGRPSRRRRGAHSAWIDMRVGPVGDPQRHLRQPPALHLPRVLPAGLQGQREGLAACDPPPRRDRARGPRSAPTAPRSSATDGVGHRRAMYVRDGQIRRSGAAVAVCGLLDRDAAAAAELAQNGWEDGLGNDTIRSGAT